MEQIPNFPKNLAYNLKKLSGSVIKQKLRISSDKSSYTANEIVRVNFPIGRMLDLRSVVLAAKCSTTFGTSTTMTGTVGNKFPRLGLNSLIEQLQITQMVVFYKIPKCIITSLIWWLILMGIHHQNKQLNA